MSTTQPQALQIDPALLAYFPAAQRRSHAPFTTPAAPASALSPSSDFAPQTSTIGVGYGASGSMSTIGVGYASSSYPTLANVATTPIDIGSGLAIDPALFQLQEVVNTIRSSVATGGNALSSGSGTSAVGSRHRKRARNGKQKQAAEQPEPENEARIALSGTPREAEVATEAEVHHAAEGDPMSHEEEGGMVGDSGTGLGEEFDPTIREIVKSLTKAQENHPHEAPPPEMEGPTDADTNAALTQALTDAQTVAAISAHLAVAEGMEHDIQTSLADMTSEQLNSFFHQSPSSPNYLLPDYPDPQPDSTSSAPLGQSDLDMQITSALQSEALRQPLPLASPSSSILPTRPQGQTSTAASDLKRKRGRPKGSKNKPKPFASPSAPPSPLLPAPEVRKEERVKPAGPPKRVGRPPKERTGAELEEYLRKKAEKAARPPRPRGRPRKFPGYLVRDMRLKANREEFREVVKRYAGSDAGAGDQELPNLSDGHDGWGRGASAGGSAAKDDYRELDFTEDRGGGEEEEYDWANDPQNLIDAVSGQIGEVVEGLGLGMEGMDEDQVQHHGEERLEDEPSAATGLGREGMFGLEHEGEVDVQS